MPKGISKMGPNSEAAVRCNKKLCHPSVIGMIRKHAQAEKQFPPCAIDRQPYHAPFRICRADNYVPLRHWQEKVPCHILHLPGRKLGSRGYMAF